MSTAFAIKINFKRYSHTNFLMTRTWVVRVDLSICKNVPREGKELYTK